jgi:hypothetical protein
MESEESFEAAWADVEMLSAAYPDETIVSQTDTTTFPLHVTFRFSETAHIQLELVSGYPTDTGIQVVSYRSKPDEKARMEEAVTIVRSTAKECLDDGIEGGFACCAAALQAWNDFRGGWHSNNNDTGINDPSEGCCCARVLPPPRKKKVFNWITGEPLLDRKSSFQAHVCRITSDRDVRDALAQLLDGNSKLQRATHHMVSSSLSFVDLFIRLFVLSSVQRALKA